MPTTPTHVKHDFVSFACVCVCIYVCTYNIYTYISACHNKDDRCKVWEDDSTIKVVAREKDNLYRGRKIQPVVGHGRSSIKFVVPERENPARCRRLRFQV